MNLSSAIPQRIAIIGGGLTGLAAAHRLLELDPRLEVALFEAGPRLGGVLDTIRRDGFMIERSADNFITNVPWAIDLCRRIGFEDQLIPTDESRRHAMVVRRGRLQRVPEGFLLMSPTQLWPLIATPILSPWGKLRLLGEYFVPARREQFDESLGSFVRRRLGREAFERLVQPLIGGIYTADPEQLSVAATMPRFLEMERQHGGLIRAVRRQRTPSKGSARSDSGARYSMFVAPRDGMASLIQAIAARLPGGVVRLNSPLAALERREAGWRVQFESPENGVPQSEDFDAVVIALPAPRAARLLAPLDQPLADELSDIPYAGAAVVAVAYRRDQVAHPLDGFGFVVPAIENRRILAGSFSSVKFPGRAPEGCVLMRVFVGGACQEEMLSRSDDELRAIVAEELGELLGVRGEPLLCEVNRWPGAMPQYHLGHCERVRRIEELSDKLPNLTLAGNAYHGVGIPNCIRSGESAAEKLLQRQQQTR